MAILIKRYANRKLYNTDTSRYITLKGIAKLLEEGKEVRVVDNETGEDITRVALSQILVDNQRARQDPSDTLLTQILSRGGDALYGAIRKSVDEATDGLGDFQDRFRNLVGQAESLSRGGFPFAWDKRSESSAPSTSESRPADSESPSDNAVPGDLERLVHASVTRAIEALDLPTRDDLEDLNLHLERIARAVERLERAYLPKQSVFTQNGDEDDTATRRETAPSD